MMVEWFLHSLEGEFLCIFIVIFMYLLCFVFFVSCLRQPAGEEEVGYQSTTTNKEINT